MSDELKPCAHIRLNDEVYVHGYVDEIRRDMVIVRNEGGYFGTVLIEVMPDVANTRANDNLTAESGISDKCMDTNDGKVAQADSREKLEADVYQAAEEMEEFTHGEKFINTNKILRWLDRQAAITERECREYPCNNISCSIALGNQNLIAENRMLHKQVDSLTAERDELRDIIDHMPKTEAECEACQDAHDRLMFNCKVDMDKLRDELKHKQLVIDRQRDSFAKMEREYRELQDVCGELERTVENLRGD